jgi:hypothetical protein
MLMFSLASLPANSASAPGPIREFNVEHIRFGVTKPSAHKRLFGFVCIVHDEVGQALAAGYGSEIGKDIHLRIAKNLSNILA